MEPVGKSTPGVSAYPGSSGLSEDRGDSLVVLYMVAHGVRGFDQGELQGTDP